MKILLIYFAFINFLAFAIYGIDKFKAIKHRWRIKEATLLGLAFIGGALGSLIAMYIFRHKTQKIRFALGVPLMLIMQIAAIFYVMKAG